MFPSPKHKANTSHCTWVHLSQRDHSAREQASPFCFIALESTSRQRSHAATLCTSVFYSHPLTKEQEPRACHTPSLDPSLHQAALSQFLRPHPARWCHWDPASSCNTLRKGMLCRVMEQTAPLPVHHCLEAGVTGFGVGTASCCWSPACAKQE